MKKLFQKGSIAIVLSVLMLSIILAISASIYMLMIQQIRASSQIGHSVVAIYAAESGLEKCFYERVNGAASCSETAYLDIVTDASYTVDSLGGSTLIESVGNFKETNRRIELSW